MYVYGDKKFEFFNSYKESQIIFRVKPVPNSNHGQKEIPHYFRFFPFSATNRNFWRLPQQIAIFQFSATNCAFFFKSEDQICAFSFKSKDQIVYGTNHIHSLPNVGTGFRRPKKKLSAYNDQGSMIYEQN